MEVTIDLVKLASQALYHINTKTKKTYVEFTQLINYGVSVKESYKQIGIEASLQNFKEGIESLKENASFYVETKDGNVHISFSSTVELDEIQEDELFSSPIALQNLGIKLQSKEVLLKKNDYKKKQKN